MVKQYLRIAIRSTKPKHPFAAFPYLPQCVGVANLCQQGLECSPDDLMNQSRPKNPLEAFQSRAELRKFRKGLSGFKFRLNYAQNSLYIGT